VKNFINKRTELYLIESLTTNTKLGKFILKAETENGIKGKYSYKTLHWEDRMESAFSEGDYEVRNGFLALRSKDAKNALYFRWYPYNNNGTESEFLTGKIKIDNKSESFFIF